MAELYFDHNVSRRLALLLQTAGHDIVAARDGSRARVGDDAQLLTAVRSGRILVTHDRRDFMMLHDAWMTWPAHFGLTFSAHPGILVVDVAPEELLARILDAFLAAEPSVARADEMFWWRHHGGWRRRITGVGWEPFS